MKNLITTGDMARMTGTTRSNIGVMAFREPDFPKIVARVGTTRLFNRSEFVRWYRKREKRVAEYHAKRANNWKRQRTGFNTAPDP